MSSLPAVSLLLSTIAFSIATIRCAAAQPQPDLTVEISDVSQFLDTSVPAGDVAEGCATATSGVDLLRLSVTSYNVGEADIILGDPMCPDCHDNPGATCGNPGFLCSPAGGHGHAHFIDFARFDLLDASNQLVGTSGKRSFCLRDGACESGIDPVYTCDYQGIRAGCSDTYAWFLGCQYVDITAVPAGDYTLRVTADPLESFDESNETNNVVSVPVTITRPNEGDEQMFGRRARLDAAPPGDPDPVRFEFTGTMDDGLPHPFHAPNAVGATLTVLDDGAGPTDIVFPLPAARWLAVLKGGEPIRYQYVGTTAAGDCRSVVIRPSRVTARCQVAAAPWTPIQGNLRVELSSDDGGRRYCATFGGREVRNDESGVVRKAAPPAACAPD
jgi:hypothetical protein